MEWQMANVASSGQMPAAPSGAEPYPRSTASELAQRVAAENDRRALFAQIHRQDVLTQMAMGLWGGAL